MGGEVWCYLLMVLPQERHYHPHPRFPGIFLLLGVKVSVSESEGENVVRPVFQDGPEAQETLSTQPKEMQEVWPSAEPEHQKIPKLKVENQAGFQELKLEHTHPSKSLFS